MDAKTIIGRAERISFAVNPNHQIPAKIDSGADISSVWASHVEETDAGLQFRLFDEGSEYYTGTVIELPKGGYRHTRIANSFGHKEYRYVVELEVTVLDRILTAEFTLANRSTKPYPILLGCTLLEQHFLIDVTKGDPLPIEEEPTTESEPEE